MLPVGSVLMTLLNAVEVTAHANPGRAKTATPTSHIETISATAVPCVGFSQTKSSENNAGSKTERGGAHGRHGVRPFFKRAQLTVQSARTALVLKCLT